MPRFAKLFQLQYDNQLLVTIAPKDENEQYQVNIRSEIEEEIVVDLKFDLENRGAAIEFLDDFDITKVRLIMEEMKGYHTDIKNEK